MNFVAMSLCKYGSNRCIDVYEQKLPWLLGHCDTKEKQPYLLSFCPGSHGNYNSLTSMLLLLMLLPQCRCANMAATATLMSMSKNYLGSLDIATQKKNNLICSHIALGFMTIIAHGH